MRAWAEIDLDALAHNVHELAVLAAPAALCAVVKADGYGHGAVPAARAALAAGASWLAVALPEEGATLREAGIEAPILVLSEADAASVEVVAGCGLTATVYSQAGVEAAAKAARGTLPVHLKVDTGMHRVGAAPEDIVDLARAIAARDELRLEAVWTHCPVADEPDNPFTAAQLRRFDAVVADLDSAGVRPPIRHAANSAATIAFPQSRYEMVRCGIATYGLAPAPALAKWVSLVPAMSLRSLVSYVKRVAAGEGISYGLRHHFPRDTTVATVPIGYADGVPRQLWAGGGEVLVGGRRRPITGVVTMDQLMVDCGDDPVAVGDPVVLIGRQGADEITADEWAEKMGTINYEIVCGIGPRVPRAYR